MRLLLLALVIIITSFNTFAESKDMELIYKDLDRIVKIFDEKAVILFDGQKLSQKIKLPGTPYSLGESSLGELIYKKINIKLVTEKEVPAFIKKMIRSRLTKVTKVVAINVFKPNLTKVDLEKNIDKKTKESDVAEDLAQSSLAKERKPASTFKVDSLHDLFRWTGIAAAGFIFLSLSYFLFFKKSNILELQNSIENCSSQIVGALESKEDMLQETNLDDFAESSVEDINALATGLKQLSKEGLKELLFDAYWSQEDSYASFIWRYSDRKILNIVINESKELYSYGKFLNNIQPKALSYHLDPYYLNPQELNLLSNKALSILIETNKSWTRLLPNLRLGNLRFSASEQLEISKITKVKDESILSNMVKGFRPSEVRKFQDESLIRVNSIKDEVDLMNLSNLEFSDKKRTITWAWGLEVNKSKIAGILSSYSAQDLASAWIGPEQVLKVFSEQLPEKKYGLIHSYLEKSSPNRNSWVYKDVFKKIINELSIEQENIADVSKLKAV